MEAESEKDIPKWAFWPAKHLAPSAAAEPNASEDVRVFWIKIEQLIYSHFASISSKNMDIVDRGGYIDLCKLFN